MLSFLPSPLVGVLALIFYTLNLFFCGFTALCFFLLNAITPTSKIKQWFHKKFHQLPPIWITLNDKIWKLTSKTELEVHLPEGLNLEKFYLVISNHQSWADILILFSIFNYRIPMLKFFLKKQLRWLPLVGMACWIYGFPFMYRYTKSQLKKHPEWKGKDFEETRRACERFKLQPGSIINFVEGTRFTKEKHDKQHSPFKYLLKPKAGGIALALQTMGELVQTLIDVTIVYPQYEKNLWRFLCGKPKKIIVYVKAIPISSELRGDYENDTNFRSNFQQIINQIWFNKDHLIDSIYAK